MSYDLVTQHAWYWEIGVLGELRDLQHMHANYLREDFKSREDADGKWWVRWSRLDGVEDAREAADLVRSELAALSGVLKLSIGATIPLRVGGAMKVHADGRRDYTVMVTGIAMFGSLGGDGGAALSRLAMSDPTVAKAFRLYGADDFQSWVGLYRFYEVIEEAAGGKTVLLDRAWTTEADHRRFKHSANSLTVGGDLARHGTETTEPPKTPMSLAEALSHVEGVFRSWLSMKLESVRQ